MTSSRLPGKVMMELCCRPVLDILIERLSLSKFTDEVIIATTSNKTDDKIEELGRKLGIFVYRGSEDDVLDRVVRAVESVNADAVIEITGDCPLMDPAVVDYTSGEFIKNYPMYDYVTNIGYIDDEKREIPVGMDVRVFKFDELKKISGLTNDPEDREHVSLYFFRGGKNKYRLKNVKTPDKWKREYNPRLTLDTREDYEVISRIYETLSEYNPRFGLEDILKFLDSNRDIAEINSGVIQKTVKDIG